jgi:hypothetical protein
VSMNAGKVIWLPLSVCSALLLAADLSWKTKPIPEWSADDARAVLADSPWAKDIKCAIMPLQNESARREGGAMGQPKGVGYDGVAGASDRYAPPTSIFGGGGGPIRTGTGYITVRVRWESSFPVRAAELKAAEMEPPTLEGEGYEIAVYGIPGTYVKGDPVALGEPFRKQATLKRESRPDVKPIRAEVFDRKEGMAVVYLFPLSAEIGEKDKLATLQALIGRIAVQYSFDIQAMRFQGKLQVQ